MSKQLLNPCSYSFNDLIKASGQTIDLKTLYKISQKERNIMVKYMCNVAGWHYYDVKGTDGVIYTAFSPLLSADVMSDNKFR